MEQNGLKIYSHQKIFKILHIINIVKVTFKEQKDSRKPKDRIKHIFKSKLFMAGIIVVIIGSALIVSSFHFHSTYYQQKKSSHNFHVTVSTPSVYNFSLSSENHYNMTFIMPSNVSLHYLLSVVKVVLIDNIPFTIYHALNGGTLENNSVITMTPVLNLTHYSVVLSTLTSNSTNVTVTSDQGVLKELPVNPGLLTSGILVLIAGVAVTGISIYRGLK